MISQFQKISLSEFEEFPDVGPIVARSIYDFFHDEKSLNILRKLEKNGVILSRNAQTITHNSSQFNGKSFVLTGSLEGLTRDEAKAKIRELGGKISSSVSKNTDYVIVGSEPGSKYENALKLGIKTLSEDEFMKMF